MPIAENQHWREELKSNDLETGNPLSAKIKITEVQHVIWHRITQPGYLKSCHPFCAKIEVNKWPGKGSHDKITYYSGREYDRYFIEWLEGVGYDIELGQHPNQTSRVKWRITPVSGIICDFTVEVIPYLKLNLTDEKKREYQSRLFGPNLQHYLDCVVKGVEYWIRTGKTVQMDQFGYNPLYSE